MASLYELNREIEDVLDLLMSSLDEETGEVDDSYVRQLEELQFEKSVKLDNIGVYMKNLRAEAEALKNEELALKSRREQKERKLESLKNYVSNILNGEKFESERVLFSFNKSKKTVIDDEFLLPGEFFREKFERSPDKTAIKKAIEQAEKEGKEFAGAHLEETRTLSLK